MRKYSHCLFVKLKIKLYYAELKAMVTIDNHINSCYIGRIQQK
jgi:hypothetical protein